MTQLDRQIRIAQRRMWISRWLARASTCFAIAGIVLAVMVAAQRVFDVDWPLTWMAAGLVLVTLASSLVWALVGREDSAAAAVALDQAAGLRERLSTAHHYRKSSDPFAKSVLADAEHVSSAISAGQHIRVNFPRTIRWTCASFALAGLTFLVPLGLLVSSEEAEAREQATELHQTTVAVKRQMDRVHKMVEATPALEELKEKLEGTEKDAGGPLHRPSDVRHQALKKIDKLADAIRRKRQNGDYDAVREMRKMLRGLKVPQSSDTPVQKVTRALARGDFKSAREEVNALREQLATLKSEGDKELVSQMSKQLNDLARQLEKLAKNEQLAKKLQQAGLKKEDVARLLERLKKEDLEQLKKMLEEKGLSQQQIEKLAKQLQKRQQAGSTAKKLAQAIKQASLAGDPGQTGEAMAGLSMAADQLSELEMLEQEMDQLEAAMAELDNARDGISGSCSQCAGSGCQRCAGDRGGMGRMGQGRGGLAPEQQTAIRFKTERGKVKTGRGAIIEQFLFDGEQVKGEVSSSLTEMVTAGERDASDRINRNRIPRQYQSAVKAYFSGVHRSIQSGTAASSDTGRESSDESSTRQSGSAPDGG